LNPFFQLSVYRFHGITHNSSSHGRQGQLAACAGDTTPLRFGGDPRAVPALASLRKFCWPLQALSATFKQFMKKCLLSLGLSIVVLSLAEGATFLSDYTDPTNGVSITSGFIPDATRIIVGEPIFLTFVVSNREEMPFQFCRVNTEIFTITATNASGIPARHLFHGLDGNGFVSKVTVYSGNAFTTRLFLNAWCEFDEPGDYTVTCRCKFGRCFTQTNSFDPFDRPIVTVFQLTVLPVDPKRVTEIINAWGNVVKNNGLLGEAAQALAEFNDPRIIPPLAALITKDANNYIAVNALARFTNDVAADALAVVLKFGEDYEAGVAATALRRSHQADRIVRLFLPELTNADANIRIQNARAVSWTGSELAFATLCSLLQDESNSVRYAAAQAIGRLGDTHSFSVLTNCLSSSDFALRIAAVNGLRALGRPVESAWVKPMILSGGENIRTYYDAIDLLRMYGGDQAAPGLASCLHFDDPSVRHSYNMQLILALESIPDGPKYYYKWHSDPNRDGTEEELSDNRQILSELKSWLDKQKQK
jgi:HEAT repeat protein